jgi:hypothetical protein
MAKEFSLEEALGTGTKATAEFSLDEALGQKPKDSGFLRQAADIPLNIGRGAVSGVRMLTDVFGAGSGASKALQSVDDYLASLASAQAKNDEQEVSRILKEAENKGVLEQVKAGFKAFAVSPVDILSKGVGTAIPTALTMGAGSALGAGALGLRAAGMGMGAGMGAGAVKGGMYEETKAALLESGVDEAKAEQAAMKAQEYGGKNLDQILLGAGLGAASGGSGVESSVRRILSRAATKDAAKDAAKETTKKGAFREIAEGGVKTAATESVPELLQGSQEQVAKNIALQREGFDVPTMRGVASAGTLEALAGAGLGAATGSTEAGLRRQARGEADRILKEEAEAKRVADEAAAKQKPAQPSPTQAIEDQASEFERQQQKQQAAMERARSGIMGGGSDVNQAMLDQARIRKEQQERAAAAQEKAVEAQRQQSLRAERAQIINTQYSADPMMNEVLRSRAISDFDAANAPKAETPKAPEYKPTKTIEQTTPIEQPKDLNVLRGVDTRGADFMSAVAERRAAQEAASATQAKTTEAKRVEEAAKVDTSRSDVDQRVTQVENFLMSPARKTQQETADYMAGVIPEMQKDFLGLLDEDMSQPLTPEQTEALKNQIRQRLQPEFVPDENAQRTPFKKFLATQGMNKQDVQDIFGENAYRANQQLPGAIKADGPRLDMLAEAAVEAGFLQQEDTEALVQMIKDEFGGNEQTTVDMAGDRASAAMENERDLDLLDRASAIGLNTKGMKPEQIAARLDRIERKREEKRKQYSRSVDGFADLPTAEQDRIIDMMIDQFGDPQVFDVERAEIEGRVREEEELLQTQSEKQLRDKQDEIDRLAKENERLSKEADRKAKADEQVGDFVLTGSNRNADEAEARGQEPMFAAEANRGYNISAEDQRIEKELAGKSMIQAADWAVANAPNAFAKVIAEKVRNRLREFQRKGMTLDFVIEGGSTRTNKLRSARGVTQFEWGKDDKGTKITVTLNGAAVMDNQGGYPPGVQYNTILHELLHVATRSQFVFMPNTDPLKKQMTELFNTVAGRFNADAKAGNLPPVMERYYKRMNNVLEDPDELLTWGLTDKEVQAYLDDIKVGEKSVFTQLVELIRKALGLGKPYESALERLVRTSESMLDIDVDTIDSMLGSKDKQIGVKKKPPGPMVQESLFQREGSPAPSWVPEKIWRLHELMQRADDEAEGRVPLRENEQGRVPTSGALKRNQTMTFRRLNAAVDEYVGGDYQKSMDLMTRMNEESNRRADEAEGGTLEMRDAPKAPPTDSAAFKKWFGSSKVVDENGEPLVVSHIAKKKGITTFDPKYKTELSSMGFHFGTPEQAEFRGTQYDFKSRSEPEVGQYYLSIKKPLRVSHMASYAPDHLADQMFEMGVLDDDSYADIQSETGYDSVETGDRLVQILKDNGYDGLVYENEKEGTGDSYVPFDPTQIKSATGNQGTYDPENADIRYQRDSITGKPILAQWGAPTDTKLAGDIGKDDLIYALQNKMIDTKRVVDAITATAGKIMAKWNPYLQEELYHGRTAKQTKDFLTEELRPLMQAMEKASVSIDDMEVYLKNRHAIAYNAQVAKVNPKMPDGGSGIKTADAQAYLNGLSAADKAKYEALAKKADAITKGTRKLLVDSGLETQEVIDNWEAAFPFYVPLKRDDIDYAYTAGGMGTGQGFDVRGNFSQRAMGSEREATDVLANIAMMRERAIVKAQKNRVAQALFGLAAQNPNPEFWLPVDPLAEVDPANMQELLSFGLSQADLDFIAKEPRQKAIDKSRNEVVERINATLRNNENVLSMRFGGENRYVFFNPNDPRAERMVKSLKNLDADQLGHVLGPISKVTRWMAAVNTQYNPIFGAYNFLRDVQGAALQLSDTPLAKDRKAVVGGTLPALKGIYAALRAERDGVKATGPWADLWTEFQEEGGQTGFRDQFSRSQERAEALQAELNKIKEGKLKAAGRATFDWLSDYNDSMENAVRLSAYKAALDKGIGKEEAASIAKNLTVNFNRKGQVAVQAGALYAFFNAAMQGTTRLVQTLSGPSGKKIMAGGFLLGTMQAVLLSAAGFDDEEPPEFVRERNLILPIGGDKYIAFPMPLGYHVIPSTSRILTEWALSGFKDTPDRIASLTGMFLEAFNPIGNAGWSAQTLAPTFADPIVALTENRDWTGKPIARKDFSNLDPTPGYTRAKDTASEFSTQIAKFLNYASGGTEFKPGVLSPTPDQIDYLIGQGTGGLGREALKVEQTVMKTATGEELPPYKIPLVGRFYGETKSSAAESGRFYKNLTKLNEHENEIKGRRESKQPTAEYLQENPEARLAPLARKTYSDIQKLRKRKEQLLERDAPRESVKQVEEMITRKMQVLNDRVKALEN